MNGRKAKPCILSSPFQPPFSRGGETGKKGWRSDLYIYRAGSDTRVEKEYVNKGGRGGYVGQGDEK